MAVLAGLAATPFLYEGWTAIGELRDGTGGGAAVARSLLVLVPLVPLAVAVWVLRAGTDANEYGIRVRALLGRRIVPWTDVDSLVPDQRGHVVARLRDGGAVHLTAVKPADLPRLAAASGKQVATPQDSPATAKN